MTEPTPIALAPKDRFLQIAREEMAKFEKSELKLRQKDRLERARELALPVHLVAVH